MRPFIAIDFEASCLPRHGRSFPIEVGIADGTGWSRAWLIRPHADWADWAWTAEAESLHGISRARLEDEGLPVARVWAELDAAVANRRVIADHYLDEVWLGTLCQAAGVRASFRIDHLRQLVDELDAPAADVHGAMKLADHKLPVRHRAANDALWIATFAADLQRRAGARSLDRDRLLRLSAAMRDARNDDAPPLRAAG